MANSKIYLGSTNIGSLFQGASDISIYLGENKVYPLGEPAFKWLATYSDSHTESAQCDSSSAITDGEINKTNLVSVEIGNCLTTIGERAFEGCSSLTSINIPNGVISIGSYAFADCSNLTNCTIGDGVTSIDSYAFYSCSSLTSIDIPDSVTFIGDYAFFDCRSLTSITIEATTPPTLGIIAFPICPIYVPSQSVNAYKTATNWSNYADKIQPIP